MYRNQTKIRASDASLASHTRSLNNQLIFGIIARELEAMARKMQQEAVVKKS
jgi:hypothetical protein